MQLRDNAIEYPPEVGAHGRMMCLLRTSALCFLFVASSAAHAACYADYKAKLDQPLRLHYGILELSEAACRDRARAQDEATARLAAAGWTLLNIVSTFGTDGLEGRKTDAGQYFLRF